MLFQPRKPFSLALMHLCAFAGLTFSTIAPGSSASSTTFAAATSTLNRPADPVVLTGANVATLVGSAPGSIVAFRYLNGWQQIPVQVDERANVDLGTVYNTTPQGFVVLSYTDPNTFTGPDPNTALDSDDEIVFMSKDAGGNPTSFSEPAGVIPGSGVEVAITDPLDATASGYVYLFRHNGTLSPAAGKQYISYQFNLLSGNYRTTYKTTQGPNPENSVITSSFYKHHFADRWVDDELRISAGGATGVNILDRHKNLFGPGDCRRSEDKFSLGEGAFVVNKSGPVRAIRSYLGAVSGPLTQREHFFYERRHDITTFLRVHEISGITDFFDYTPAASGMRYYNNRNLNGVVIDGTPDSVVAGTLSWELVTGAQGSLTIGHSLATNIPNFSSTSYYLDDTTPSETQCTGDAYAYGSSGSWINQTLPTTDPLKGSTYYLTSRRKLYYEAPGTTVNGAQQRSNQSATALTFSTRRW